MDNNKVSTLTSEIIHYAEEGMKADAVLTAIRETFDTYPHKTTEAVIIDALFDRLEKINTNISSVWWRAVELRKELATENTPEPIKDGEEVTENDLPFK